MYVCFMAAEQYHLMNHHSNRDVTAQCHLIDHHSDNDVTAQCH